MDEKEISLAQELESLLIANYSKEVIAYFQAETKEAEKYIFVSPPLHSSVVTEIGTNG